MYLLLYRNFVFMKQIAEKKKKKMQDNPVKYDLFISDSILNIFVIN